MPRGDAKWWCQVTLSNLCEMLVLSSGENNGARRRGKKSCHAGFLSDQAVEPNCRVKPWFQVVVAKSGVQ